MKLEDRIKTALDNLEITEEEDGRLVLYSSELEDIQKPFEEWKIPVLGKVLNFFRRKHHEKKGKKLSHHIARNLEGHLTDNEELLRAFTNGQSVRVNYLSVNLDDRWKPSFLTKCLSEYLTTSCVTASILLDDMDLFGDAFLKVFPVSLLFSCLYETLRPQYEQAIDLPLTRIDEVKKDIEKLSRRYSHLNDRYGPVQRKLTRERIAEMKAETDVYLRKVSPSIDTSGIGVEVKKIWGAGRRKAGKDCAIVSQEVLESDLNNFYSIYAHEALHIGGTHPEGRTHYLTFKVLEEMAKDHPERGCSMQICENYLLAASHAYICLRREDSWFRQLVDIASFNAKRIYNRVSKKEQPCFLDDPKNLEIVDELGDMEVPSNIIESAFLYESLKIEHKLFFLAQHLIKKDGLGQGYTVDLYKLLKERGEI